MPDVTNILWLIPALPLLASALIALIAIAGGGLRQHSHWLCIGGAAGACVLSFLAFFAVAGGTGIEATQYFTWFRAGNVDVGFTLHVDGLTAIMLVTVTFVGTLIAIYSVGYMHDDPGYARYFAEISLFLFSMTGLVLAENFILLYAFWEGVGVCSYLLIGYYFRKPAAAAAARKAFLVTRLGDIGLFLGILLLWSLVEASRNGVVSASSLNFDTIFKYAGSASADTTLLGVAALLLFCGAVGKSAQFPLHVWLPDAMEGPSPVSALIHAATMVTAGVYLVARCTPLFVLAPEAQLTVACIGGFTALLAALIALTQTDLKRVLAYSTISQLGYMFLALGCAVGKAELAVVAVCAAIFHLFTHAFFKALLFLTAGSVMHSMGGVIDMRRFSGLRHVLPRTHLTFLCGAAALAGVPLLSGFWSKDEILASAFQAAYVSTHGVIYGVLFGVGVLTAGLTAFYTFRAYFLTFWGEERVPHEAGHHAHESPPMMIVPCAILAVGAVALGLVVGPTGLFEGFLHHNWLDHWIHEEAAQPASLTLAVKILLMLVSSVFAVGGIALAWWLYLLRPALAAKIAGSVPVAYEASRNRFYLDEIYDAFLVKPLAGLAQLLRALDQYVVDGLIDLVAQVPRFFGFVVRPIQNGLVQFYALLMALGVAGFLLSILLR